jgi:hypothetical protein
MRRLAGLVALCFLCACGGAAPTPTIDVRPTQTRAAEITQVGTLQTQVAVLSFTPTAAPPTATPTSQPTATLAPTATATKVPTARPTTLPTVAPALVPAAKIGERGVAGRFALTIAEVRDPVTPGQFQMPKSGFRWVAFDVIVENTGAGPLDYNAYYSRVKTTDNREYTFGIGSNDLKPQLQYGVHQQGESSRGWIGFEIQEGAQLATFTYTVPAGNLRVIMDLR